MERDSYNKDGSCKSFVVSAQFKTVTAAHVIANFLQQINTLCKIIRHALHKNKQEVNTNAWHSSADQTPDSKM